MQTKSENNCRHSHKRDLSFSKRGLLSLSIGHSLFHAGGGVEGGSNHRAWGRHSHKRDLSFSKRGLLSLSIGHSLFHANHPT